MMKSRALNEAETRAELIDPALREAGWGVLDGSRVERVVITPGRLIGARAFCSGLTAISSPTRLS